jgi:hypothetical protein
MSVSNTNNNESNSMTDLDERDQSTIDGVNTLLSISILSQYFERVKPVIDKLLSKKKRSVDPADADILQTPKMAETAAAILLDKQIRMQFGKIWEILIGHWFGFEMIPTNHKSHCDVVNRDTKTYIQLKNRYNTTCSDAATQLKFRLASFKRDNPDFTVVWGIINPRKKLRKSGLCEEFTYDGETLEKWHGKFLFDKVFTYKGYNFFPHVLHFIKSLLSDHGY